MRVVSLLASGTEIVSALGAGDMLVGRSHECDNPPWVTSLPACTSPAFDASVPSGDIDREVKRRLAYGEPLYQIDTRRINELAPDLLITQTHCDVCAVTPGNVRREGGVAVDNMLALQAGTLRGIYQDIRAVGAAIGREDAARELINAMTRKIDGVRAATTGLPNPTVVILEWVDPVFAAANWIPELVAAAGASLAIGSGERSRPIDWQDVIDADPEFLIVAPCGFDLERTQNEASALERLPGWFGLQAVRADKVAVCDGNRYFNRSGVTVVETAEIIAEIVHETHYGHRTAAWRPYHGSETGAEIRARHAEACARGEPSYLDPATGYQVLTADFLLSRGACCGSGCRHCPYGAARVRTVGTTG